MTVDEILKEIEERVERATPGPWAVDENTNCIQEGGDPKVKYQRMIHLQHWASENNPNAIIKDQRANLQFIAAARTDVPRLVKALRIAMKYVSAMDYGEGLGHAYVMEIEKALRGEE